MRTSGATNPALLVLASLAGGNKHGYAIMEDVKTLAGVRLGPGTLYGAITRLERKGWIRAVQSSDRRQPYSLSAAGRKHLNEQVAGLGKVVKITAQRLQSQ